MDAPNPKPINCVLVGDATVGKTCFFIVYTTNTFPGEYIPTVFDRETVEVQVDGDTRAVCLCDTPGQDDYEKLRPLDYLDKQVILLCFSLASPISFGHIKEKWYPEVRKYAPNTPIILVGMKLDLREDKDSLDTLLRKNERPITEDQGRQLASEIGAVRYIECSSLAQVNVRKIIHEAVRIAVQFMAPPSKKKECILS